MQESFTFPEPEQSPSSATVTHSLSEVDEVTRTAWCAGCNERVKIARQSKGRWQCGPRNRQRANAWRKEHPDREAASHAARRAADPEKYREMRQGVNKRWMEKNRQEIRDKLNAKRLRLRQEVIAAYGCRCNCPGCHVVHAELLTLDHVIAVHHRARRSTRDIMAEVKKLGFPADYQMLCGSCNLAKGDRDKCPLAGEDH